MEHSFWHDKWERKEIGFHQAETHHMLLRHVGALGLYSGSRIFVPLCGKTLDIGWLLSQGFQICGAELSELAVSELFDELGAHPLVEEVGDLKHYHAPQLDIWVGDVFALTAERLGPVDAIYDRAAMVALPQPLRIDYTRHLQSLAPTARQLLITFEYDQLVIPGPPFSVTASEIKAHYGETHSLVELSREPVAGGLKGQAEADEIAWLVTPL